MKAVFGVGLLLVGFTVGYLVLTGKIPAPATAPAPPTGGSGGGPSQVNAQGTSSLATGNGPMGLPTMQHLHDVNASLGGMQ